MAPEETPRARTTIYSVADRAGVSIATVSRVLQGSPLVSEKTRDKVLQAADELDYLPSGAARSLAVRHHETLGLVLPELGGPYYAELLMGFESRAGELQQSVMLVLAGTKNDRLHEVRKLSARVDGIAVLDVDADHVGRTSKPVVIIAGHPRDGAEAVAAENLESAKRLTEHLFGHGRTRLLFIGDTDAAADVRERYEGFAAAHRDRGLEPAQPVRAEFRESEGAVVAERILAQEFDADALVCGNDELALAIMAGLTDGGVDVPGDIAVVGWDDVMTARYVRPGLTTVRQPVQQVGALAADRLHELVNGAHASAERRVLPTEVVIRGSCGCLTEPTGPPTASLKPTTTPHP